MGHLLKHEYGSRTDSFLSLENIFMNSSTNAASGILTPSKVTAHIIGNPCTSLDQCISP